MVEGSAAVLSGFFNSEETAVLEGTGTGAAGECSALGGGWSVTGTGMPQGLLGDSPTRTSRKGRSK